MSLPRQHFNAAADLPYRPMISDAGQPGHIEAHDAIVDNLNELRAAVSALSKVARTDITSYLSDAQRNGSADCTPSFQQAYVDAAGAPLYVPDGIYRFDASIASAGTTPPALTLEAASGATFQQNSTVPVINLTGPAIGASRSMYADAPAGASIIQCSTTGITVGDWIAVQDNAVWPGPKGALGGEYHRVKQIDTAGQLRIHGALDHDYTVARSGKVRVRPMLDGVSIRGGTWTTLAVDATRTAPMIRLTGCSGYFIGDTTMRATGGPGITLSGSVEGLVDHPRFYDLPNDPDGGHYGYGVEWFGPTMLSVVNEPFMSGGRHMVTTNSSSGTSGVPRHCYVIGGQATAMTETCYDTHEEGEFIHFVRPSVQGTANSGVKHRAPNSTISDPTVLNIDGAAVRFLPTATGGRLSGGVIDTIRGPGIIIQASDVTVTGAPVVRSTTEQGIFVDDAAHRAVVESVNLSNVGTSANPVKKRGIDFAGTSTGHRIGANVRIDGTSSGVVIPATVTGVSAQPIAMSSVTTAYTGALHRINQTSRRGLSLPGGSSSRATLTITSGRAYVSRFEVVDADTWVQVNARILITASTAAATDTVEHALYDLVGNRLATAGATTGIDTTGVKALPPIGYQPLLGQAYLHVLQFTTSTGSVTVECLNFANALASVLAGTTAGLWDAGYCTPTAGALPATLPTVNTTTATQYPHVWAAPPA